jgi:uncharacterized membrane protein
MRRMVLVSMCLVALAGPCTNAQANEWRVCNKTPEHLLVAIGYHDPSHPSEVATEGWYELSACGGCAVVLPYQNTDRNNVYLFGQTHSKVAKFVSDNPRFCVSQGKGFRHYVAGNSACPAGAIAVGFQKVTIPHFPDGNYSTNLEPGEGASGCFEQRQ